MTASQRCGVSDESCAGPGRAAIAVDRSRCMPQPPTRVAATTMLSRPPPRSARLRVPRVLPAGGSGGLVVQQPTGQGGCRPDPRHPAAHQPPLPPPLPPAVRLCAARGGQRAGQERAKHPAQERSRCLRRRWGVGGAVGMTLSSRPFDYSREEEPDPLPSPLPPCPTLPSQCSCGGPWAPRSKLPWPARASHSLAAQASS